MHHDREPIENITGTSKSDPKSFEQINFFIS